MRIALIGHTGFVGGAIDRRYGINIAARYNSANIHDIVGEAFDLIICAGAPGAKWKANDEPMADAQAIHDLMQCLSGVAGKPVVDLVSTIDVIDAADAYGAHRLWLENAVMRRFEECRITRYATMFGEGMKKNVLYDMIHGHRCEHIAPNAVYQWCPVSQTMPVAMRMTGEVFIPNLGMTTILASEPISAGEIRDRFFPRLVLGPYRVDAPCYDVQEPYFDSHYAFTKEEIFAEMEKVIAGIQACL